MKSAIMRIALFSALLACLFAATASAMTVTGLETESVDRAWETNAFFSRMEALTGVHADAHGVSDAEEYQALLSGMAGGEIPADVLFKAGLTREQEISLLDAGAIVDLAPLIEENMPNLSALFAEHPEWREAAALPDGRIASLPQLTREPQQVMVWINRAWLDRLGIAMPETTGELTDALLDFINKDANGNGDWDEIGADLTGVFEMRWLLPFFGVVADDYNLARGADGALVFAPDLPEYRAFVEYLRTWYEQGILTRDAFTTTHSASAYADQQQRGEQAVKSGIVVTVAPYTNVPSTAVLDYEPLLLAGPDGRVRWRDMFGGVWPGCFAVTSACADPAQALRWADALYGEEGGVLAYAGAQGEDYDVNASGWWYFMTDEWRTIADIRTSSIIYTGETMPGLVPSDFLHKVDSEEDRHVLDCNLKALAVAERVVSPYALDMSALAEANELAAQIGGEVDRGIARFVTGEEPIDDAHWNAWLDALHALGSDALVAAFAGAE